MANGTCNTQACVGCVLQIKLCSCLIKVNQMGGEASIEKIEFKNFSCNFTLLGNDAEAVEVLNIPQLSTGHRAAHNFPVWKFEVIY